MDYIIYGDREQGLTIRQLLFPVVLIAALSLFLLRLWVLQVVQSEELTERARTIRTTRVKQLAPRGEIVDIQGRVVAGIQRRIIVTAIPKIVRQEERELQQGDRTEPTSMDRLSVILGIPKEDLIRELEKGYWRPAVPVPIHSRTTMVQATRIAEAADLAGIDVVSQPVRYYPDSKIFAHALGYVWTPNQKDVERLQKAEVEPAQFIGKLGVERMYEKELMGVQAELEVPSAALADVKPKVIVAGKQGSRLHLGLDAELQRFVQNLLNGREGSVVALDPQTFTVLCMVNSPTYDAAPFLRGITQKEYAQLDSDPNKPMLNRAIYTGTAPGSTFKIVTAMAAAEAGVDITRFSAFCRGGIKVGNRFVKCLGNHGTISFRRAMAKSCNAYFIALGRRAGEENLRKACQKVGIGERSGIDTTGELPGVNPTREWIEAVSRDGKYVWYPGDTANFSIGQGYVSATPLQMAMVAAMVANGGKRYSPHLVKAIEDSSGRQVPVQPKLMEELIAPAEFWAALQSGVEAVMAEGTGAGAGRVPGLVWAGKTGSAERAGQAKTDSWFVAYAPADKPVIALCVRVAGAGHGSEAAVPIAREFMAKFFKLGAYAPKVETPISANPQLLPALPQSR